MIAKTSFGQWLKQRRKALDITCENLAQRIGCAAVTLYKIEADERRPSKQIAERFAQYLNIAANEHAAFIRFARAETAESAEPWGTPFHPPTNLPAQPTRLIGREEDVAAIQKRLLQPECRLLTLTGPPGIGKTRLALQVASSVLDNFADGVFFVALAPITDATLVPTTIANTLDVPDVGPRTSLERLKAFLRDKETLLLLDNFEHILAAAPQIAELLAACPWLTMLVTSRAPLRIRQERQSPVSPLAAPDLARLPDLEGVMRYSAVTLFMERAQAVKPDFSLTQEYATTVAAICIRLDGLPLAIELISARVKLLSPAALLERLQGRLMLQSDGLRDLEPRHRTLNAAIDWSYQLLNAEEQLLFRRLGVFVGGWQLGSAGSICLENLKLNILDGLTSLLDKNLVKQDTRSGDEPRFIMLETIREYALEQLVAGTELEALQQQHADYFVRLAEAAAPALSGGEGQGRWWDRLEIEHANFRAVLAWTRTEAGRETGLRLALALGEYWAHRGHLTEGNDWLTDALARFGEGEAEALSPKVYRAFRARVLAWLGLFAVWLGDLDVAPLRYGESVALFRELGDRAALADSVSTYGMMFVVCGDYERAGPLLEESLALSRELGHTDLIAQCLLFLGNLAYSQGRVAPAGVLWEESLVLLRTEGNSWIISTLLAQLAMVALDESDYGRSSALLVESLTRLRELDERWQTVHTLEVFACLAAAEGRESANAQPNLLRSARIFGAAERLRETIRSPILSFHRHFYERGVATLHAQLNEATLAAAWAEGRAMTLDQVVAFALDKTNTSGFKGA